MQNHIPGPPTTREQAVHKGIQQQGGGGGEQGWQVELGEARSLHLLAGRRPQLR